VLGSCFDSSVLRLLIESSAAREGEAGRDIETMIKNLN
jgi:hypothetical protein